MGRPGTEFVAIYTPLIDRLARANGLQSADAADLAQEVFRAVAGAIDRYDPDPARGSFRSWLFRIARNLMINLLAARRIRPQATGDSDVQELLERIPAPDGAETAFFDLEYRRRVFSSGRPTRFAASSASRPGRRSGSRPSKGKRRVPRRQRAASRSGRCTSPGAG